MAEVCVDVLQGAWCEQNPWTPAHTVAGLDLCVAMSLDQISQIRWAP